MNQLQTFNHQKFGRLEILLIDGKEYFPSTDVAKMLGYSNPHKAINDHCKKHGLTTREVIDSLGRTQSKNFISEGNLYRLIARSKLTEAEKFESWVFDEVLPSIRRTGSYESNKPMTVEDMIITQAQSVKELKEDVNKLKAVVDNEVWLNERQKKTIQDSVSRRVFELRGKGHDAHFQTLYSSLKRFFGVSKYDKIPRKDFDEAVSFISGWYPPVKKDYSESR